MTPESATIAIVGPTGSGKTGLSIELAKRLGAEIISMDSRQVYRGMDVGTAKATPEQRALVPHFGIDLVDPDERFNAGRFAQYSRERIHDIRGRGRLPMLVGGTGFFLRALTHPIFREPALDPGRRTALEDVLGSWEDEELRRWLMALDPASGDRLQHWGGRQRLLRALELPLLTGRPLAWWHANSPAEDPPLQPLVFVLELPRPMLDQAIDLRVESMVQNGLVEEVAGLVRSGYDQHSPGMNATGYIELLQYLRGEIELSTALDLVRKNTRAYSRRQVTWFRSQLPEGAVKVDATMGQDAQMKLVLEQIERVLSS